MNFEKPMDRLLPFSTFESPIDRSVWELNCWIFNSIIAISVSRIRPGGARVVQPLFCHPLIPSGTLHCNADRNMAYANLMISLRSPRVGQSFVRRQTCQSITRARGRKSWLYMYLILYIDLCICNIHVYHSTRTMPMSIKIIENWSCTHTHDVLF